MASSTSASFATYNVLNPYHAVKWAEKSGLNEKGMALSGQKLKDSTVAKDIHAWRLYSNWDQRCQNVSENVQFADVVCLQEVSRETIENLEQLTKGYRVANVAYHSSFSSIQQFGNAILYQPEKARLNKAFELTHGIEGSERSAACGIFEVSGKVVKVASVHLAGYYPGESNLEKKQKSKERGYEELQTYVKGLESHVSGIDGIVIGGDFNEDPSEAKYELYRPGYLESNGYRFDGNLTATEPSKDRRIDWLCYKPLASKKNVKLTSMGLEGIQQQASDHLMTGTVIEWGA